MDGHIYGVLGGYGSVAALRFHQLVIEKALAKQAYLDTDFPSFILDNVPLDVIDERGLIDEARFDATIEAAATRLEAATDVLVLCNSFHVREDLLLKHFGTRLHSLIGLMKSKAAAVGAQRPLLLGSVTTIDRGLYESSHYEVRKLFMPELIAAGMAGMRTHELLSLVALEVETQHADAIMLGCTDLTVFADEIRKLVNLPVIDSVEVAVEELMRMEEI
jgi:aspartate/glutamate racemase